MEPHFKTESLCWKKRHMVFGIDEVGRGSLAGPLTLSAVGYPADLSDSLLRNIGNAGIRDSKQLSEKRRTNVCAFLRSLTIPIYTAEIPVEIINEKGIMYAWRAGVGQLCHNIKKDCHDGSITVLVDGSPVLGIPYTEGLELNFQVKGDTTSLAIASASIIAKVERDAMMKRLGRKYPEYQWDRNKGYGTAIHRNAIQRYGLTPHHRTLFVRSIIQL